ncbi:MAG: xanthine dehydrogenase family protein molybdopterin-binding subunit [Acidobacteria bacterium]|nr:MAG: xanthine dehydrogenase family protein molybdopterin-binding subunit [Acidobacteriota bacterium]
METSTISRRELLKGTGALVVSFSLFGSVSRALAQAAAGGEPEATSLDSWLAIAQDGTVTVFTSKVELGTGTETALAQIVAEELDVPFSRIHMEAGDTSKSVDQAVTAASRTIERAGPQLRQAAAVARRELLRQASERLNAPADQLTVNDGVISASGASVRKVSYSELVGDKRFNVKMEASGFGWDLKISPDVPVKNVKDYKIVGTSVPRTDLPGKFTGEFTYAQDVRLPGMLHGRVVRPPVVNSKPLNVDEGSIKQIAGVVKVVQEGNFLGVVAQTEWAAIQAAKALKVTWSTPSTTLPATPDELYAYLKDTKSFNDQVVVNRGNADSAFAQASKKYEATFRWPFQLHGMLGPSCAVADVRGDSVTVWSGTQGPFRTRKALSDMLRIPEKNIRVIFREESGCYGRLSPDDAPLDAALLSRAVGKPVRVQWTRADEHGWEPKGPAQLVTVRAGVDAQGNIVAWDYMERGFPWSESAGNPLLAGRQIGMKNVSPGQSNGTAGGGEAYEFENQRIIAALIPWSQDTPTPLRTSNLRAPGDLARTFASESLLDEIAADLHVDPVQIRLRYLKNNKRVTEVLVAATQAAKWKEHVSHSAPVSGSKAMGRGVSVSGRDGTVTAAVAEVEVDKSSGEITIKRVTLAHDCGLIVNPDGLRNQIEGNIIQGVSRTLLEEVRFDAQGVKNLDWVSYPIVTFRRVPDIQIVLLNRKEMPALGGGEPSTVPVPAAIANAVYDAIGVRMREVPMTPQKVQASLRSKAPGQRA